MESFWVRMSGGSQCSPYFGMFIHCLLALLCCSNKLPHLWFYNQTSLLSYSCEVRSPTYKFNQAQKSRCWQDYLIEALEGTYSLPFAVSGAMHILWLVSLSPSSKPTMLHFSSSTVISHSLTLIPLPHSYKDPCDYLRPTWCVGLSQMLNLIILWVLR